MRPLNPDPIKRTALALMARLQMVMPVERFGHAFVPAKIDAAAWKALTRRTPFVGLGWNDVEGDKEIGRLWRGESRWTVFLVARNAGGVMQRYVGDAQGIGLMSMVSAAVAVLHGWTLSDEDGEVGAVSVTRAGNLFAEGWDADDMALAGIDVSVGLTLPVASGIDAVDADLFETLGIDWSFAPPPSPDFSETVLPEEAA